MTPGAAPSTTVVDVDTPAGPARVHVTRPRGARGLAVLGHGAGGGLGSVDLTAAATALTGAGWAVALVEQPWLVAGWRIAGPPKTLDAAWVPVVNALRRRGGALATVRGPLLLAGRSAGARVACRTADTLGADAVLCFSFPLHPPGRPERLRATELALVTDADRAIAVVQGERDPFGGPGEVAAYLPGLGTGRQHLYAVPGTHAIPRSSAPLVEQAVAAFASTVLASTVLAGTVLAGTVG